LEYSSKQRAVIWQHTTNVVTFVLCCRVHDLADVKTFATSWVLQQAALKNRTLKNRKGNNGK
jgi:hypothetical protein